MKKLSIILLIMSALVFAACETTKKADETGGIAPPNEETSEKETPATTKVKDGYVVSEEGTAKAEPASGKANVQGKVLYNGEPAADIEVKLCEKFSTFSGCSGDEFKTKTDENGEYLFKDVDPKDYAGLLAKVFDTPMFIFAAQSFGISSAKYKIEADTTFFAPPTNLFKSDLKVENLKSKAKIDASDFELKWGKYEDAAYYKFSIFSKDPKIKSPYYNEKVEGESFKFDKPFEAGEYRLQMDAYNENDVKLSQLKEDITFDVTGSSESKGETESKEDSK